MRRLSSSGTKQRSSTNDTHICTLTRIRKIFILSVCNSQLQLATRSSQHATRNSQLLLATCNSQLHNSHSSHTHSYYGIGVGEKLKISSFAIERFLNVHDSRSKPSSPVNRISKSSIKNTSVSLSHVS